MIDYEWTVEITNDETDDIYDYWFGNNLKDVMWSDPRSKEHEDWKAKYPNHHFVLVLIRDVFNDFDDVSDRSYAYPEGNKMPTEFDNGIKVPKRFFVEYGKAMKSFEIKGVKNGTS